MLTKRILLVLLALLVLTAPALSLAESDYEEGDGWVYRDGTLTITENGGLKDFISNDQDEQTGYGNINIRHGKLTILK